MIFFILLYSLNVFAEKIANIELKRPDQSKIIARLTIPDESKPFGIVLHLQGSACESVHDAYYDISSELKGKNFAHLLIEKPGVIKGMKPEDCFKESYLLKNDIFTRANDAFYVLEFIKKNFKWNERYFIIGKSEGTIVATLLAKKKYPIALALIAGANGMTMEDEFLLMLNKGDKPCGLTSKTELKKKIDAIYLRPDSKETWCSSSSNPNSFYWWSRILRLSVLEDLKTFDFPIWVAHGTLDESVPIETSIEVEKVFLKNEKKNLYLKRFEGLNHSWRNQKGEKKMGEMLSELDHWLLQF